MKYIPVMTTLPAPSLMRLNTVFSCPEQSTHAWTASRNTRFVVDGPNCVGNWDSFFGDRCTPQLHDGFTYTHTENEVSIYWAGVYQRKRSVDINKVDWLIDVLYYESKIY